MNSTLIPKIINKKLFERNKKKAATTSTTTTTKTMKIKPTFSVTYTTENIDGSEGKKKYFFFVLMFKEI